jgi:hypothetical protein
LEVDVPITTLSLSLIYSGSGLEFDLLLRARGFLGPSVDLGPSPEMDYVMVQRQDKVFKCHANNSPVSGHNTTFSTDFLRATVRYYFSFGSYDLL